MVVVIVRDTVPVTVEVVIAVVPVLEAPTAPTTPVEVPLLNTTLPLPSVAMGETTAPEAEVETPVTEELVDAAVLPEAELVALEETALELELELVALMYWVPHTPPVVSQVASVQYAALSPQYP